ncbi:MAG: 2-oxo-4-hydroxy-4-carboxy-5-ureidoimidazoline decarboxylase, partial [Candidatus Brocadiales bacterium]|nr:2-oxo-4-hydroxy-4-carboxy-5-ureidoimidazoline decarboxylase [Candidatus Brocadiales bacterium]
MSVVKTINDLNALEQGQFIDLLADIFEHSSWIAKNTWSSRPFISVDELHQVMCAEMQNSDIENQLALLRAHPELAGTAALEGDLTAASSEEQKGAGLTHLLPDEIAHITRLNQAYGEKFGFP